MNRLILILTFLTGITVNAQLAFEGTNTKALGAAATTTTGGRGQSVYHVTNLNNSGAGSFRDAVSTSNRTIVFDVSGTINLTSSLNISADNLTIAGQTAPEGGIAITGSNVYFDNANNIILRYVRFRPDYNSSGSVDALNVNACDNFIIDHCSISWGGDEALSIIGDSDNWTIQYTIMGESATGTLAGDSNNDISSNISIIGNIWYNISHRHPNANANRVDVINNLSHNWNTRLMVVSASATEAQVNQINNYYQRGARGTNVLNSTYHEGNWLDIGSSSQRDGIRIYAAGNVINDVLAADDDQWAAPFYRHRFDITSGAYAGIDQWDAAHIDFKATTPFTFLGESFTPITAAEVLTFIPTEAGANRTLDGSGSVTKDWDVIDDHYLGYITTNTYQSYSYPPTAITGASHYTSYQSAISSTPINSRDGSYDTDGDGIPNAYEIARGWNLSVANNNTVTHPDGYTQLEEFLNLVDGVEEEPEPEPDGNVVYPLTEIKKAASRQSINKNVKI